MANTHKFILYKPIMKDIRLKEERMKKIKEKKLIKVIKKSPHCLNCPKI